MNIISKQIILDELIENSHIEKVEDVILWALEKYYKDKNTRGSLVAYSIIERVKEAENGKDLKIMNPELVDSLIN